jgi:arsenate reductase
MTTTSDRPYRVLFLCTGNSARSQIAEALLNARGGGRFAAESAGTHPADRVNPGAIETLREIGLVWNGHPPRTTDGLEGRDWDLVITVCDSAREACPILPGHPLHAHWGMEDPAAVVGSGDQVRRAFREARQLLMRRIDLLLALPLEKLDRMVAERRIQGIAADTSPATA